jgi:TolB protein
MRVIRLRSIVFVGLLMLMSTLAARTVAANSRAADAVGTIAYARDNEIRLIGSDGKNDRRLWQKPLPEGAVGIRGLQWRPDGSALAFGSGFQWLCSQYSSDIYTIRADGSGLKRLTNSPECGELAGFPKGSVKVRIENATLESIFALYIEGAPEAQLVTVSPGAIVDVTVPNVADLGNFPQAITVINGKFRYLDPSVTVDVKPNQLTAASTSFVLTGQGNVFANVGATIPAWHRSGSKVGFLFQEGFLSQITASPAVSTPDTFILAPGANVIANALAWSPISDWVLYSGSDAIAVVQPGANDGGIPIITKDPFTEIVLGLEWLPDESGFLFAITGGQFELENSNLYEFNFDTNELTALTNFKNEFAGAFSLSPDAQQIVFELTPDINEPAELWIMRRDGTGQRSLGVRGIYPDWRPGTGIDLTEGAFLPAVVRP